MRLAAPSHARRHQRPARASTTIDARPTTASGSGRWPGTPTSSPTDDVRRVQPLVALALANVAHADHPQPRYHRRLARARRRRRRDAGRAEAARRLARRRLGPRGRRTIAGRRPLRRPAGVVAAARRDRGRGVLPGAGRRRGVAFEEVARRHGDYALCRGRRAGRRRDRARRATSRSATCRPSSTSPAWPTPTSGDAALEHLDPADDIHATAAYRAQLVRVLTAGWSGGEGDGPAVTAAMTEELHDVRLRSTASPTRSRCPRGGCSPTRSATTSA